MEATSRHTHRLQRGLPLTFRRRGHSGMPYPSRFLNRFKVDHRTLNVSLSHQSPSITSLDVFRYSQ